MTEYLDPYEVARLALNNRSPKPRFEVTITGPVEAVEIVSDDGVKITIDGIDIPLHHNWCVDFPQPKANIKVRLLDG